MLNEAMFSSGKDDWETPQEFFKLLDDEFYFTLDAAATDENTKCENWLSDALKVDWSGRVFCNPPYSRPLQAQFIEKAYWQNYLGNTEVIVLLLPARTDTIAFHQYVYGKAEIRFIKGRLKFEINGHPVLDKKTGRPTGAPFPSMLVIYRGE